MFFIWSKDKKIKGAQCNIGAQWMLLTWADAVKVSGLSTLSDLEVDPCSFNSHRNAPMAVYAWLSNFCVQRPCYVFTSPLYCMLKQPLRQCHVSSSWKSRRCCCFQFPWSTRRIAGTVDTELNDQFKWCFWCLCGICLSFQNNLMCEYQQINTMKGVFHVKMSLIKRYWCSTLQEFVLLFVCVLVLSC